jgi:tetratricopeptide (TPR) repeat protein
VVVAPSISDFEKEVAIHPGYANAYYKLADAYTRVQKFDEAEKLLERSIWLDANSTGPYILSPGEKRRDGTRGSRAATGHQHGSRQPYAVPTVGPSLSDSRTDRGHEN